MASAKEEYEHGDDNHEPQKWVSKEAAEYGNEN
jgi:hypothetical protein